MARTTASCIASGPYKCDCFPPQAMSRGELLTRLTIWLALGGAAFGAFAPLAFRANPHRQAIARAAWTVGCLALLAHVACAYHFYHGWSQDAVYRETARQTAEVFGLNWGGGVYVNYAFIAAWLIDVLWWWRGLAVYNQRPRAWALAWQSFFLFIVFNATVVFKTGMLRWIGLVMCIGMTLVWWIANRSSITNSQGIKS